VTLYLESSAALAWLFGEPAQDQVLALLAAAEAVYCSRLTILECGRALVVAEVSRRINAAQAGRSRQLLARARQGWSIMEMTTEICQRALQRFPREPVRSLDAIHLASLLELHAAEPTIQPLTLDQRVRDNALELGFSPLPY
jgi:predicted nucleic acid-binding protein